MNFALTSDNIAVTAWGIAAARPGASLCLHGEGPGHFPYRVVRVLEDEAGENIGNRGWTATVNYDWKLVICTCSPCLALREHFFSGDPAGFESIKACYVVTMWHLYTRGSGQHWAMFPAVKKQTSNHGKYNWEPIISTVICLACFPLVLRISLV